MHYFYQEHGCLFLTFVFNDVMNDDMKYFKLI